MNIRQNLTELCTVKPQRFKVNTPLEAWQIITEINSDLIYWIIDLMTSVVRNESVNGMSAKAISIVFAPNLFVLDDEIEALNVLPDVITFLSLCVQYRLSTMNAKH
jgi:hypothetical protein